MIFFLRPIEVLPINMTNHIFAQKILCLLHAIDRHSRVYSYDVLSIKRFIKPQ